MSKPLPFAVLKAIAEENRFEILRILTRGKKVSVTELSHLLEIPVGGISRHLAVLRRVGLVRQEKRAQLRLYSLAPSVRAARGRKRTLVLEDCIIEFTSTGTRKKT